MVFPIADDNSDRTSTPVVNIGFIVINAFVFFVFQRGGSNTEFTYRFPTVPAEIITGRDLSTAARQVEVETPTGLQTVTVPGLGATPLPVYLTLLTSMFMHGGLMHLLGNMWFLWIFGDNVEHDLGRIRYLVFY